MFQLIFVGVYASSAARAPAAAPEQAESSAARVPAPTPAAAPVPVPAPVPVTAPVPAPAGTALLVAISGDNVQNSDWDFISSDPPAAPAAAAPSQLVVYGDSTFNSSAVGFHNSKPTVEDRARKSRRDTTEANREAKRKANLQKRRSVFPQQAPMLSSLQAASAAVPPSDPVVVMGENNTQVVDAQDQPVTESALQQMILQYAQSRNEDYETTRAFLASNTDAQVFVNNFSSLLADPSQAWRNQEEEVDFTEDAENAEDNDDSDDSCFGTD